jgi:predicted nucleotidyltransferase
MSEFSLPETMPTALQHTVHAMLGELRNVSGVLALVIGGSYARGNARPDSDVDIGIYYDEEAGLDIDALRAVAQHFHSDGVPTVTALYGWGAWVNGGAWIKTPAGKVDFLYRNLAQVQRVIDDCKAGRTEIDFAQQPTFGFHSVIYMAETSVCLPVYDPQGHIAALKASVALYPPVLRSQLVSSSMWSAQFTAQHARGFAERGDIFNTVGCLLRAAYFLTHALYALNKVYYAGDKGALEKTYPFARVPSDYVKRVNQMLTHSNGSSLNLSEKVAALEQLISDVRALANAP